jgi:hypothetical protein
MAHKSKAELKQELEEKRAEINGTIDEAEKIVDDIEEKPAAEAATAEASAAESPAAAAPEAAATETPAAEAPVAEAPAPETAEAPAAEPQPSEPAPVGPDPAAANEAAEPAPAPIETPQTVAEAMENARLSDETQSAIDKLYEGATPLSFGEFLDGLGKEADQDPQGMQGVRSFSPPRPLPDGVTIEPGAYRLQGANWEWIVVEAGVERGVRSDMTHLVTQPDLVSEVAPAAA